MSPAVSPRAARLAACMSAAIPGVVAGATPAAGFAGQPRHDATTPAHSATPAHSTTPLASREPDSREPASPEPDSLAVAIAVRRILNAVAESVLACTNPTATTATTAAQPDALNAAVSLPELLRTFLSDDERAILKVLARASSDAHLSASCVRLACQDIEKSKFWPLWANLQVRGLIREVGSGKKRWYVLGAEWLRIILS